MSVKPSDVFSVLPKNLDNFIHPFGRFPQIRSTERRTAVLFANSFPVTKLLQLPADVWD